MQVQAFHKNLLLEWEESRALQHALGGFLPGSPPSFVPVVYIYIFTYACKFVCKYVCVCTCERESRNVVRGGIECLTSAYSLAQFFFFLVFRIWDIAIYSLKGPVSFFFFFNIKSAH